MQSLTNKTILITGASSGIGREVASLLAAEPCNVVICARRAELLMKVAESFPPERILVHPTDVTKEQEVDDLFRAAVAKFGSIDILINNAGVGMAKTLEQTSSADWSQLVSTNLTGVFLCTRAALPHMRSRNTGHIITVSSIAGLFGLPDHAAYCAVKHGVTGLMRAVKRDLRGTQIKVTTLYPGPVKTDFFAQYKKKPNTWLYLSSQDVAQHIVLIAKRSIVLRILYRALLVCKRIGRIVRR